VAGWFQDVSTCLIDRRKIPDGILIICPIARFGELIYPVTVNGQDESTPFILIAEDNTDDRLLLQYAFRSARLPNRYHIVNNGAEAITWLTSAMEEPHNPTFPAPALLVLDIQMPYKTGLEVLEWVRSQTAYRGLTVIIMSGLQSPDLVERALGLGARSYLFKPGDYSELTRFINDFNLLQAVVPT